MLPWKRSESLLSKFAYAGFLPAVPFCLTFLGKAVTHFLSSSSNVITSEVSHNSPIQIYSVFTTLYSYLNFQALISCHSFKKLFIPLLQDQTHCLTNCLQELPELVWEFLEYRNCVYLTFGYIVAN